MIKPDYCTQNDGNCPTCSLVNYGRDCANNRLLYLDELARVIAGGNPYTMAKLVNDAGMTPQLDELEPDPGAFIPRPVLVDLVAIRTTDRTARKLAELLRA